MPFPSSSRNRGHEHGVGVNGTVLSIAALAVGWLLFGALDRVGLPVGLFAVVCTAVLIGKASTRRRRAAIADAEALSAHARRRSSARSSDGTATHARTDRFEGVADRLATQLATRDEDVAYQEQRARAAEDDAAAVRALAQDLAGRTKLAQERAAAAEKRAADAERRAELAARTAEAANRMAAEAIQHAQEVVHERAALEADIAEADLREAAAEAEAAVACVAAAAESPDGARLEPSRVEAALWRLLRRGRSRRCPASVLDEIVRGGFATSAEADEAWRLAQDWWDTNYPADDEDEWAEDMGLAGADVDASDI